MPISEFGILTQKEYPEGTTLQLILGDDGDDASPFEATITDWSESGARVRLIRKHSDIKLSYDVGDLAVFTPDDDQNSPLGGKPLDVKFLVELVKQKRVSGTSTPLMEIISLGVKALYPDFDTARFKELCELPHIHADSWKRLSDGERAFLRGRMKGKRDAWFIVVYLNEHMPVIIDMVDKGLDFDVDPGHLVDVEIFVTKTANGLIAYSKDITLV